MDRLAQGDERATGSSRGDRTTYQLQDQTIEAGVTTTASRFVELGAEVQWLTAEAGAGQSGGSLDVRFDPLATPGFGSRAMTSASVGTARADW